MPRMMRIECPRSVYYVMNRGDRRENIFVDEELERRMEARRLEEDDETSLKPFRRGWCLGSEEFKKKMLDLMERKPGENHSGELHREGRNKKLNGSSPRRCRGWPGGRPTSALG